MVRMIADGASIAIAKGKSRHFCLLDRLRVATLATLQSTPTTRRSRERACKVAAEVFTRSDEYGRGMSDVGDVEQEAMPAAGAAEPPEVDLDAVERDLDAVETALERLADCTYGTDEITGEPIPDPVLENNPTARRA